MGRLLGRLWVGFTTCLIAFIAYSAQIFVIWPWYGRELSIDLLILLVPFNLLVGILYWNYYLCVKTDPGGVPKSWEPDVNAIAGYEVKRLTTKPRYCSTCRRYKPPRAHHCRQCNRCILRMDHHCPWVNNCVGHFNYAHFIRFLFYVDVSCSYHLAMVTKRSIDAMNAPYWEQPEALEFVMIVLNYTMCIPVLLAVGGFSLYHFYCLCSNTTTIEGWEKDKVARLVKRGKILEVKFPYNLGLRQNIMAVLGDSPLLWCWPKATSGTGTSFKLAPGNDFEAGFAWPPQDPTNYNSYAILDDEDDSKPITLPSSPWTYENGSYNPDLAPSNAYRRSPRSSGRSKGTESDFVANVPPYHPDYEGPSRRADDTYSDSSMGDYDDRLYGHKIRRGSEGFEVKQVNREEILRNYVASRGEEGERYNWYVPESYGMNEDESEENDEDDIPLGKTLRHKSFENGTISNQA